MLVSVELLTEDHELLDTVLCELGVMLDGLLLDSLLGLLLDWLLALVSLAAVELLDSDDDESDVLLTELSELELWLLGRLELDPRLLDDELLDELDMPELWVLEDDDWELAELLDRLELAEDSCELDDTEDDDDSSSMQSKTRRSPLLGPGNSCEPVANRR